MSLKRTWLGPGLVLLLLSVIVAGTCVAGKSQSGSLGAKIERQQHTLKQLQEEIDQNKQQADEADQQRHSVLQSIQELDDRLMVRRQERYALNRKLKKKDHEVRTIHDQVEGLREHIRERQHSMRARLRVQYMEGRFGYLKALLSAESPMDFHRRLHYLASIARQESHLVNVYRQDVQRLEEVERTQAQVRDQMLALKRDVDTRVREARQLKKEKRIILATVTREKDSYHRVLKELQESASRVDSLLHDLEQRRQARARRSIPRAGKFPGVKGALHWPVTGEVVSFFGRQKHPTFQTYVQHKGIEIRTKEGSPIRAVMAGTVSYADWLKGYGLVLILDHGNGFFSLYAHASKIWTKVGEQVNTGAVIGETGDTGFTEVPTLYFELRKGHDPVDPLLWLAKRP